MNALSALDRFARAPAPERADPGVERCRLCAEAIADEHPHLVDLERRALLCSCATCARLLGEPALGAPGDRYRVVPTRVRAAPGPPLADAEWAALRVPVRLAFLFFNSRLARWVALYPSPAGATEAELPDGAVEALGARLPLFAEVRPDVEALLVHGRLGRPLEIFLAPIDACYRLVGTVRRHWKGFHGGDVAWDEIERFFAELRARAGKGESK